MIIVAAFSLNVAHPGPVFTDQQKSANLTIADSKVEAVRAVSEDN